MKNFFQKLISRVKNFSSRVIQTIKSVWKEAVDPDYAQAYESFVEQTVKFAAEVCNIAVRSCLSLLMFTIHINGWVSQRTTKLGQSLLLVLTIIGWLIAIPVWIKLSILISNFVIAALVFAIAISWFCIKAATFAAIFTLIPVIFVCLFTKEEEEVDIEKEVVYSADQPEYEPMFDNA